MNGPSKKGQAVLSQFAKLKSIRDPLDKEYRDCYEFTFPTLGTGFCEGTDGDGVVNAQTSNTKQARLFDSTGTDAVRLLASSVLSSLTPPNVRWFNLADSTIAEEDLDQAGKEWLEDAAALIHTKIHSSNYDSEALEFAYHEMIAGMAGLYIELKGDRYYFETWPLNHLYCQETLNLGFIDTVYRQFFYTAEEAVVEFGLNALPEALQRCYKEDEHSTKKHRFVVGIRPRVRNGKVSTGKTRRNLPWESIWVAGDGTVVRESGFHEMPVIVPRWLKIPDTDYARGPVFDALPDIKSLNKVKENMHLNMDMHIAGMFKVKDDGVVNPNTIKFGPRRMIPVGDMENIQPLAAGGDIQFAMNEIASLQGQIRRILLADQLGPTEKAMMTATEVATRNNQVRQILGPIFARLQSEFLTHTVERCFGLALRAGLLPTVPDSLAGREFNIEYRSPLARAQKMQELEAIDEMMRRVERVAQAKPDVLDHMNYDKAVMKFSDLLGIDPELVHDEDAVKKIRYQRDQNKKDQQAAAQSVLISEKVAAAQRSGNGAPSTDLNMAL